MGLRLEDIPVEPDVGGPLWVDVVAIKAEAVRRSGKLREAAAEEFARTNSTVSAQNCDNDEYEPLGWGWAGENPGKARRSHEFAEATPVFLS